MSLQFQVYRILWPKEDDPLHEGDETPEPVDAGDTFEEGSEPEDIKQHCGLTAGRWFVRIFDNVTLAYSNSQTLLIKPKRLCFFLNK